MLRILAAIFLFVLIGIFPVSQVFAACTATNPALGCDPAGINQLADVFRRIIEVSVGLAFVVLVILLVQAGIKFLTSGGEAKAIQAASMTMTWAILGILFLVIAWLLLLLIEKFTGVNLTIFDLKVLCRITPAPPLCP